MSRRPASLVGRGRAWRKLARLAIAAHVRANGWACPGWARPPHPSGDLTGDHVIAIAAGGLSTVANIQVLCRSCNARKGSAPARADQLTFELEASA